MASRGEKHVSSEKTSSIVSSRASSEFRALFNQLLLFYDGLAHMVAVVQGNMNPLEAGYA